MKKQLKMSYKPLPQYGNQLQRPDEASIHPIKRQLNLTSCCCWFPVWYIYMLYIYVYTYLNVGLGFPPVVIAEEDVTNRLLIWENIFIPGVAN